MSELPKNYPQPQRKHVTHIRLGEATLGTSGTVRPLRGGGGEVVVKEKIPTKQKGNFQVETSGGRFSANTAFEISTR